MVKKRFNHQNKKQLPSSHGSYFCPWYCNLARKLFWKIPMQRKALRHRTDFKSIGVSGLSLLGLWTVEQIHSLRRYWVWNSIQPSVLPSRCSHQSSLITSQRELSFYKTYLNVLWKFFTYLIASFFIFTKICILSYSGGLFLLCSHFVSLSRPQCEVIIIPSVKIVWVSVSATQFSSNVIRMSSKMRVSQAKSYFPSILQVIDLLLQVI